MGKENQNNKKMAMKEPLKRKMLSQKALKTITSRLPNALKRLHTEIEIIVSDTGCRAYFRKFGNPLFSIRPEEGEKTLLIYYRPERGNLVKYKRLFDPERDSLERILDEVPPLLNFYMHGQSMTTYTSNETKPATDDSILINGLKELVSKRLECATKLKKGAECFYEPKTNTTMFKVEKNNGQYIFVYFDIDTENGVRFIRREKPCEKLSLKDAWGFIKPLVTYCECCLNRIPYDETLIGLPISIKKHDFKFHIPPCSTVEIIDKTDYLSGDYILAIIPMLKESGAVYYPDYPVRCKYDWSNGKYALPFEELKGLLDGGCPIVRIVDPKMKCGRNGWAEKGILKQCGYHVDSKPNGSPVLNDTRRRVILSTIIESPLIAADAIEVLKYLQLFISNAKSKSMERARRRWLEDYSFVVNKYHLNSSLLKKHRVK